MVQPRAAHRLGRRIVLIPSENARHLEELPPEIRDQLTIHLVSHMDEVVPLVLERMPEPRSSEPPSRLAAEPPPPTAH